MQLLVSLRAHRDKFIEEHHTAEDNIFALVKSGSFYYETPNGKYTVSENEGALFPAGLPIYRRVLQPATLFLFRFKSDEALFDKEHILFADTQRIRSTIQMLDSLENRTSKDAFKYRLALFTDIVTQYQLQDVQEENLSDAIIMRAVHSLEHQYHKKLDLKAIAQNCALSYPQFIRRFKQAVGMTPMDYLSSLRLNKAKTLLSDSELLIRDIAPICGFDCEYYFSKFFKKHVGVSPAEFRKNTI